MHSALHFQLQWLSNRVIKRKRLCVNNCFLAHNFQQVNTLAPFLVFLWIKTVIFVPESFEMITHKIILITRKVIVLRKVFDIFWQSNISCWNHWFLWTISVEDWDPNTALTDCTHVTVPHQMSHVKSYRDSYLEVKVVYCSFCLMYFINRFQYNRKTLLTN